MRSKKAILLLAGLALVVPSMSRAAAPRMLGQFRDWSAHIYEENGTRICYLYSEPKKEEGDYTKRGKTYTQVANRPAESVRNEVSVTAGYTFKRDSNVEVVIGSQKFRLFTDSGNAWAQDSNTDQRLVAAMKAGSDMVVRGTSSRGTLTTDTYSLLGFTAAHGAMESACR